MEIRILGAHQSSSATTKSTSMLVDGILALDAGSVASALTLAEQDNVKVILLTHQHYDHIKDIPAIGLNNLRGGSIDVFCIKETREAIFAHLFNDVLWPDLTKMPSVEHPVMKFHTIEPLIPFDVNGYQVLAISVRHPVPTVGFQVSHNGRRFFYTADMGGDGDAVWPLVEPNLLITEVTFPNRLKRVAYDAQHMTPAVLARELTAFRSTKGYIPKVVVLHMNVHFMDEVRAEVAEVAQKLGADIRLAHENMVIEV